MTSTQLPDDNPNTLPTSASAAPAASVRLSDDDLSTTAAAEPAADSLRSGADSLRILSGADSLQYGDSLLMAGFRPADSLATDSLAAAPRPLYRPASAREVFGSTSLTVVATPKIRIEPARPLTGNPWFEGLVLLLAAAYALLLYRHIADIKLLFYRVSHERTSGERLMEDPGGNTLARFLKIATAIGLLFIGIAAAKYAETLLPPETLPELPGEVAGAVSLLFAAVWIAVVLFQSLLLFAVGAITLSRHFMVQLRLLKRTYFALAVIFATPPLLLFALCPPGTGKAWFYVLIAEWAITAILYVRETLHLFLSKKIPILHWFLYLCTVEIFPFSLLWLLAVR
ncbi:MAG: DUF4271 domain-containing protein [Alistipes sp.]|nr:DUF4271 domain-containing protein [Alistipes senegalensis]MCM1250785.1 DUF4271 domain-containing protein [Alistipes sp.]